jgi:hypothetical protein
MVMLEVLELQVLKQLVIIKDSKFTYDTEQTLPLQTLLLYQNY